MGKNALIGNQIAPYFFSKDFGQIGQRFWTDRPSQKVYVDYEQCLHCFHSACITVMIQSFWTDRSGQTVQTQIRLLLEEQSDQGLHCLLFHLHFFTKYPEVWPLYLNFR